jgi:uncharacterized protein YrzB (UPF0473 family)
MDNETINNNENENEVSNIITLTDEDGNKVDFEFLDLVTYEDKEYVVVLPVDEDSDEVVIMQVEEIDDENESYSGVEDEDTLQAVFDIFKERNKELFDFE